MEIIGNRKYVEVPGERTHELPPLLVRTSPEVTPLEEMVGLAASIVEDENLVPDRPLHDLAVESLLERQKFDLALNLAEQYQSLLAHWSWGDSILEWIRQCEITFESQANLRNLLRPDLWPHAGRASFVTLLTDKAVPTHGVGLENAVGLRLTFRQPPPISCFSDQFLFYLNNSVGVTAYQTWAHLNSGQPASLPPERFKFQVVSMALH
jgi:hypothetical protein